MAILFTSIWGKEMVPKAQWQFGKACKYDIEIICMSKMEQWSCRNICLVFMWKIKIMFYL